MRGRSAQQLEEMLRTGASRARRDPSPALRSKVQAAIDSEGSGVDRESLAGPVGWSAAREPWQVVFAAAVMLVAIGLCVFAFLDPGQESVRPSASSDRTASNPIESTWMTGISAVDGSGSPEAFARLARAGPRTLRTAVDDPLFAELNDIAEDATRTVRFLAGRVPASLVTRPIEDPGR